MASCGLKVHVRRKWWVMPFTHTLAGVYRATGWNPSPEKVAKFLAEHGFIYSLRSEK